MSSQWCEVELKPAAVTNWESGMSLLQYFKKPLLPDPRGSLSQMCLKFSHINYKYCSDGYTSLKSIPHKIFLIKIEEDKKQANESTEVQTLGVIRIQL